MKFLSPLTTFAADYDCAAYGAGTYNNSNCTTTSSAGSANQDGLADTGYDILIPIALGIALVIAGAALIIKKIARRIQRR